jgi:hypothetical protein
MDCRFSIDDCRYSKLGRENWKPEALALGLHPSAIGGLSSFAAWLIADS